MVDGWWMLEDTGKRKEKGRRRKGADMTTKNKNPTLLGCGEKEMKKSADPGV